MDMLVLCNCGHPTGLHTENGCRAGRYCPCACLLTAVDAVDAAIATSRTPPWKGDGIAPEQSRIHK
jgi:hypothetical protein